MVIEHLESLKTSQSLTTPSKPPLHSIPSLYNIINVHNSCQSIVTTPLVEEGLGDGKEAGKDSSSNQNGLGSEVEQSRDLSVLGVTLGVGNDVSKSRNGPGEEQRGGSLGVVETGDPAGNKSQSSVLVELHVGLLGAVESLLGQLQLGLLGGHRGVSKQQGQGGLGLGSPVAGVEGLEEAQNGEQGGGGNDVLEVEREGHCGCCVGRYL